MPQVKDLTFSPGLTKIAVEVQNRQMVAEQVLPLTPHTAKSGKYKTYSEYDQFDIEGGLIGPTGMADEVDHDVSETAFALDDFGIKGYVPAQAIDNADAPIDPMADMTRKVTAKVLRLRERRVAVAVLNTSNYATANKNDEAGFWATTSNDVWGHLMTGLDACNSPPNVLVMDVATFRAVQRNAEVLKAIKGTLAPQFVEQAQGPAKTGSAFVPQSVFCPALAEALGIERVVVGAAKYATSKKGQTLTKGLIWDLPNATKGGAAFLRVAQNQVHDVVFAMHLYWKQPLRVLTLFEPDRGADGSYGIKVVETTKIQLVSNQAGYLFQDTMVT